MNNLDLKKKYKQILIYFHVLFSMLDLMFDPVS